MHKIILNTNTIVVSTIGYKSSWWSVFYSIILAFSPTCKEKQKSNIINVFLIKLHKVSLNYMYYILLQIPGMKLNRFKYIYFFL